MFFFSKSAPQNIHDAFVRGCPYVLEVSKEPREMPNISPAIPPMTIIANDDDGIVLDIDETAPRPLE